jgi:hypothetical protein
VAWEVEYTDEFDGWWEGLGDPEQRSVAHVIRLLEEKGPNLPYPHSSKIASSRHNAMRELRIQHQGHPFRVLYIFDPRRMALLLLGGDKTGDNRWYERMVPKADEIYDRVLQELQNEE